MKMNRRKENAKQDVKQEKVVGVIEIPITAEADCLLSQGDCIGGAESSALATARYAVAPPRPTLASPTTVIRVDLVNLLNELEAELRGFHQRVRDAQDGAA